jgi:hypothetical protein
MILYYRIQNERVETQKKNIGLGGFNLYRGADTQPAY